MSDKMRPTANSFPESPNEEERTGPDQQRRLDDVDSDSLPGPSRITTDSAPVLKTPTNRGRKRKSDEAFLEEENEDGTAMATKHTRRLADVEPEPLPGPSGISQTQQNGRKRNASKAFPEKKYEDGTATATKQARLVEPEPLPGPSGISQTQQNADVDFTPVWKAGKKALKKTDRGRKRRADEAFSEEENEDGTEMATKRTRHLADVEPEPLPGPSGISQTQQNGRKRNASKAFPEKKYEDGTATATKQARLVEPEPLPGPSGISQTQQNADVDFAPVWKAGKKALKKTDRGRKRRADEAFSEEENEDGTAMAIKLTRHLADVEPEPLPGPSGISPNIADSTPVPMEITPNVHGRKRNASKAFPEKKYEDGTATATKQARLVEPEPLPGPSGISQTQQNADVDFTPVWKAGKKALKKTDRGRKRRADEAFSEEENEDGTAMVIKHTRRLADVEPEPLPGPSGISQTQQNADVDFAPVWKAGKKALKKTDRGGKRRADEAFPEDEKDEDETAMVIKRMRCLADVEPGFLFRHGEMPNRPSGINPAAHHVKWTPKRKQRVQRTRRVNPTDEEDFFETQQRRLSSFLRVTPDETFMSRYEVFPDDRIVHGRNTRIYSGIYKYDGREVVLKCVRVDLRLKRFRRHAAPGVFNEIITMLEIQHLSTRCSNLIQMHDWYLCPDGYILVLEKLSESWVTLDRFISESYGPLNTRTCQVLCRQLVRAIAHITERGVKHCTLVPEHTMVNRDTLELKIISFGKCQHIHRDDEELEREVNQIGPAGEKSHEYAIVATCSFMSVLRCFMDFLLHSNQVDYSEYRLLIRELWQFADMFFTYGLTLMEPLLELPWMAQDD